MKEPYRWDYTIRVKTKEGTFEYEDSLENIDTILEQHEGYDEVQASKKKLKCDKCNIELSEVFIQHSQTRTYRLCSKCNALYLQYAKNIKILEKQKSSKRRVIND